MRIDWESVLEHAAGIARSYDTPVTLRQVFYRLVADATIVNTFSSYTRLARLSAEARRDGLFPDLIDGTRRIIRPLSFEDADNARAELRRWFRLDRTQGQPHHVLIVAEKSTLEAQLEAWYDERGIPVTALRGYGSTPLLEQIDDEQADVILYVGDFDPTGEDIERVLSSRLSGGTQITRVAVTPEQVREYDLPPMPGKATDPRARGFAARHGELVQVEVEALDPNDLRALLDNTLSPFWDEGIYQAVVERERRERERL
jgi:hypothetical protein